MTATLQGVIAAVPTPRLPGSVNEAPQAGPLVDSVPGAPQEPDLSAWPALLAHVGRHLHGALVCGTTGEGPSLGLASRLAVLEAAAGARPAEYPEFTLLAGTGCAALEDTVALTRRAFELGYDGAVVLPPFYFAPSPQGLVDYYEQLLVSAVPRRGRLLAYHIPTVSGVPVPVEVCNELASRHPNRFAGIKDSGGDLSHTERLIGHLPRGAVFTGNDRHLASCLRVGGAGSITALANLAGSVVRSVWEAWHQADPDLIRRQARLSAARAAFESLPSVAAVKALLADHHGVAVGDPFLPLAALDPTRRDEASASLLPFMGSQLSR